ncbi:MAG: prenyltransferase [Myxococcales bacterium]
MAPAAPGDSRWQQRGAALSAFVRLGRPQFLLGGFLLFGLGSAAAVAVTGSRFDRLAYAVGQGAITCIQLMTHYANDYFDLGADQANTTPTRWSGGSRVLPGGLVSPHLALRAARLFGALAALLVTLIVLMRWGALGDSRDGAAVSSPAVAITVVVATVLILAALLAWFYSAPPLTLHSRGLGEATTALVVTGLTPLAGFLLQVHVDDGWDAARGLGVLGAALWPLAALQFAMLLAIEFPDAVGDAAVGKRTLVVRLGGQRAAALYRAVLVAAYGALPLFLVVGAPRPVMVAAGATAPLAAWQFWRLGRGAWSSAHRWESLAFWAVATLVATAAFELAAFLWII